MTLRSQYRTAPAVAFCFEGSQVPESTGSQYFEQQMIGDYGRHA
tara:strand:+ start:2541 stop:2672 length:132 start_codon:yes stop_codon:yes gene_type:complete